MLAPSRDCKGLRTYSPFSGSKEAGTKKGLSGYRSYNRGRIALLLRIIFQAGSVQRVGSAASYRAVQIIEGEPHLVRQDLGTVQSVLGGDQLAAQDRGFLEV